MEKLYTFTEHCETGIPFIDDGHERLFAAMKDGIIALSKDAETPASEAVSHLLTLLEDTILLQFLLEEAYLIERKDPELEAQRKAHAAFRKAFAAFQKANETADSKYKLLDDIMMYLHRWISQHILPSDAMIGKMPGAATAKELANAKRSLTAAQKKWHVDPYAELKKRVQKRKKRVRPMQHNTSSKIETTAPPASTGAVPPMVSESTMPSVARPSKERQTIVIKSKNTAPVDPFAFTREFHTNIPLVDQEHEYLFTLIRRTNDIVHDPFMVDKFDAINEILEELRDYTIKHFADEERYMASISYDGLAAQQQAHRAFVERISDIHIEDIDEDQDAYLDDLITFLVKWLVQHILKVDKKIPVVQGVAETFK